MANPNDGTGVPAVEPPKLTQPKRRFQKPAWVQQRIDDGEIRPTSKKSLGPITTIPGSESVDIFSRSADTHAQILKEHDENERRLKEKEKHRQEKKAKKEQKLKLREQKLREQKLATPEVSGLDEVSRPLDNISST